MTWLAWHLIRRISWDPVLGLKCSYVRPVYCQQCPESTQARETSHQIPKGSFGYLTADEFRGYPNVYVGIVRAGKLACMCNHSTLCFYAQCDPNHSSDNTQQQDERARTAPISDVSCAASVKRSSTQHRLTWFEVIPCCLWQRSYSLICWQSKVLQAQNNQSLLSCNSAAR